jgi:hypothetical protein
MSGWRRLSERGTPALPEKPPEGLPDYLKGPVLGWFNERMWDSGYARADLLRQVQLDFRLSPPLPLADSDAAVDELLSRMGDRDAFALDLIDYALHHMVEFCGVHESPHELAGALGWLLTRGGSAWEIVDASGDGFAQLAIRSIGPTRESIEQLPPASRAREHLTLAWNGLMGRDPDPSTAYREAVKALEAVAKPVIVPTARRATLGSMVSAMRDAPEKWTTTLGDVEDIRRQMDAVLRGQTDRHGSDDPSVPLAVSQEEADFAVHSCVALVRLFAGGHVRRVEG